MGKPKIRGVRAKAELHKLSIEQEVKVRGGIEKSFEKQKRKHAQQTLKLPHINKMTVNLQEVDAMNKQDLKKLLEKDISPAVADGDVEIKDRPTDRDGDAAMPESEEVIAEIEKEIATQLRKARPKKQKKVTQQEKQRLRRLQKADPHSAEIYAKRFNKDNNEEIMEAE